MPSSGADEEDNITRDNLANSINALDYESRRTDIFVGVDVFGRGCLGVVWHTCAQLLQYKYLHTGSHILSFKT